MAVYPFYVEVDSSTRKDTVGVGARKKISSINTNIYQRNKGEITNPFHIRQFTLQEDDGKVMCVTEVYFQGELLKEHITEY